MDNNNHIDEESDDSNDSDPSSTSLNDSSADRKPLKLKFSISLSSLLKKKETDETQVKVEEHEDADADADADADDTMDMMDQDEEPQESNAVKQEQGADKSSMPFKEKYYAQDRDQYSNTESESNMNMKEDEDMDTSIADGYDDKSQEEKTAESQDEEESEISATKRSRTRSASMDIGDAASNSQDEGASTSNKKEEQENAEKTSRSAAAVERELLGFREPVSAISAPTTSFLDSLSEEQRRVRTRHLPDVAGFRRLHKSEIKRDMGLVRKMLKAAASAKGGKRSTSIDEGTGRDTEAEKMDVDVIASEPEDESMSDVEAQPVTRAKSGRGHLDNLDLANIMENPDLPSIFSLPYTESPYICTDVEGKAAPSNELPSLFSSPKFVESITAFNPPRPPESVGPKTMHRLSRWERNPQDVEFDLNKYRKTVTRTRNELHKAEDERERIEAVGQHLRTHFMTQLQCMRHEMDLLNESYEGTQTQCVKAADLLTSKTRSRGAGRGSSVMKDVLSVLKSRGDAIITESDESKSASGSSCSLGVGGISNDRNPLLANGWLLPGDKVSSAYGEGVVAHTFGPTVLDVSAPPPSSLQTKSASEREPPQSQQPPTSEKRTNGGSVILPPRICVTLPFGLGYFCPENLKSMETPSMLSDDQLAKRWMNMIETSKSVGSCIDFAAVDNYDAHHRAIVSPAIVAGDDDGAAGLSETSEPKDGMVMDNFDSNGESNVVNGKLLPYGSSLLPSSSCRGGGIESMSIEQLEKNVSEMLDKSSGVLGAVSSFICVYSLFSAQL